LRTPAEAGRIHLNQSTGTASSGLATRMKWTMANTTDETSAAATGFIARRHSPRSTPRKRNSSSTATTGAVARNPQDPGERDFFFQPVDFKAQASGGEQQDRNKRDRDTGSPGARQRRGFVSRPSSPEIFGGCRSIGTPARSVGDCGNLQAAAEIPVKRKPLQNGKDAVVRQRAAGPIQGEGKAGRRSGVHCGKMRQRPQDDGIRFHLRKRMSEISAGCETFGAASCVNHRATHDSSAAEGCFFSLLLLINDQNRKKSVMKNSPIKLVLAMLLAAGSTLTLTGSPGSRRPDKAPRQAGKKAQHPHHLG